MNWSLVFFSTAFLASLACLFSFPVGAAQPSAEPGTFGHDVDFLRKHCDVIVLQGNSDSSQIAVVADYQGRVMTSTANGEAGASFGWLNHDLIASGETRPHINVFGGEDRFWIGPEGGQFSIFFKGGDEFTLENWQTPAAIDIEPFSVVSKNQSSVSFQRKISLKNYSGFPFDIQVDRDISVLSSAQTESALSVKLGDEVKSVGFQSDNRITNIGSQAWHKDTGLLSIWILGMFNPSDQATIIVPYKMPLTLNSDYFGDVPADRLVTTETAVLFKGDGRFRSKIGLPPESIVPVCGSYDAQQQVLTIVQYSFADDRDYVNSQWKLQDKPYGGDVVNSYNDGPVDDGTQLGPFYELESSSPAKPLAPGESVRHVHKTFHIEGDYQDLNRIAKAVLGVDLDDTTILSQTQPTKQ
ncbi:DUF6786 family protein [Crateriforma conspicua]|uniref:DUF6786 family protein n=1 Tax=Crateriforma conspicua TaxID=2527996 RepID=UPI00118BFFA9|nr:DUF6786 family protein [Crateriforma conspicua]QDV62316.1 hypothetical protein Mal65_14500 [Crateriforma conspicua]